MKKIRWNSEKPMAMAGTAAPARNRHGAPLACTCDQGHAVVGLAMSFTGTNEGPRGLEGGGTG